MLLLLGWLTLNFEQNKMISFAMNENKGDIKTKTIDIWF